MREHVHIYVYKFCEIVSPRLPCNNRYSFYGRKTNAPIGIMKSFLNDSPENIGAKWQCNAVQK